MSRGFKLYGELFLTFFKMGCCTFGGGYAMLPVIERELVARKKWAAMDEIMDYYVIGQITPGIIAVNVSTFVGYKLKGIPGGIIATLGFVLPSLIIITLIAAFLRNFADLPPVRHAFAGIRVAVGALILDAVIKLFRGAVKDRRALGICVLSFGLSLALKAPPALIVLTAALAGFLLYRPRKTGGPADREKEGGVP
jgi:chromate transporter